MKKRLVIFFLLIFPISIFSQDDEYKAYLLSLEGIEFINNKEYDKAIKSFNEAIEIAPNNIEYHYEKALAFTLSMHGDSAIAILEGLIKWDDATDLIYQLLATNYIASKRHADAATLLKNGIERFPKSGRLYAELAGTEHGQQSMSQVMPLWEKGVSVDPNFADNYYYLAEYFSFTGERIWALIYGEIYLNWVKHKDRKEYITKNVYFAFNESCFNYEDSTDQTLRFTLIKIKTANPDSFNGPFEWEYEYCHKKIIDNMARPESRQFSIKDLNFIREKFIDCWYSSELDKRFDNALFDWQKKIIELGYNDAYGYWLMEDAQPKEFEKWLKDNTEKYQDFMNWIEKNPLKFDEDEAVYRLKYK
jgi:tetratricopeptide (TPR) repeat protein